MSAAEDLEKTLAAIDAELGIDAPDDDTPEPWAWVDGTEWRQPPESGTEIRHAPPEDDDRPRWCCYLKPNPEAGIRRAGVWYHGLKQGKKDEPPQPVDEWLCSPLLVEAVTRTPEGSDFGRLLRFQVEGRWRIWNMPMRLLGGDPAELRRELLAAGVEMDHRNPRRVFDYLTSLTPRRHIHAALEVGWHGAAFVLPDRVFGEAEIHFQSESALVADYAAASTLQTWQDRIARPAIRNKPLVFAISAALAGPLLHPVHKQGAGFHLMGGSSCGKTTTLQAAASVWGPPPLVRNWRATANGLEAAAAEANDLCLILDEIGECTPKDVGRVVYAMGNGTGKIRATQKGYARRVRRWRTVLISSGEKTLDSILREAGERVTAGQDVRLLSLPADGFAHGVFDELHGHANGADLANAIKTAASETYGTAGRAWLTWLADHLAAPWADTLRRMADSLQPENGQEARAAEAFALVAMAGEKAIEAGILPWETGEAVAAVREMWERWREQRGQGPAELRQVVEALSGFIARYEARFEDRDYPTDRPIHDRAGYIKDGDFHFIPAVFKEAIGGMDANLAKRLLFEAGYLAAGDGKHLGRNLWVGKRTQRVVSVRADILDGEMGGKSGKGGNVV